MTVKELRDHLDMLISKYHIGSASVEFWVPDLFPEDPNDLSASNHRGTIELYKSNIYINSYFNGETWDDSNESYDYLEIKVE